MTVLEAVQSDLREAGFRPSKRAGNAALWVHRDDPERVVSVPIREPLSGFLAGKIRGIAGVEP